MTNLAATRRRLVARSVTGRYDAFLGLGGGLAVLGLLLFGSALGGEDAARTWHLFQVNWVYFTGLAGGSVALAAVHKVVNARWSGLVIRFAEASVAFLPVSLLGLFLIFTVGYPYIYGHMAGELHTLQHGKAVWLSHGVMFGRLLVLLVALYVVGWRLVRADMVPDMFAAKDAVSGGKRGLFERMTAGYDGSEHRAAQFEALYLSRRAAYQQAHARFDASAPVEELVERILDWLGY